MSPPEVKKKVSEKRKRNFIAKELKVNPKFKQKVIEDKRKDADPEDDYTLLDNWLTGEN